jgi:alkyl hydroperoxide reductase subunit F
MKNVSIYTTSVCKYCEMTKQFFKDHNVKYNEFNVGSDPVKRAEMIEKSGQMGVPVITVDNEVIVGFDEDRLTELLVTA